MKAQHPPWRAGAADVDLLGGKLRSLSSTSRITLQHLANQIHRPHLRVVPSPPRHELWLEIRLSATLHGQPIARSRNFLLSQRALDELIGHVLRLEKR